jgi:hypothetical protein
VTRQIISKTILAKRNYEDSLGIMIPYGLDILIFVPRGQFEITIKDPQKKILVRKISNSEHKPKQFNISFLQYVNITREPELFIKSIEGERDYEILVMFTLL